MIKTAIYFLKDLSQLWPKKFCPTNCDHAVYQFSKQTNKKANLSVTEESDAV